jgi:ribonuclease P protein component
VVRNRVKRHVREWFRRSRARLPRDTDVVVIGRPGAAALSGGELSRALDRLVERGEVVGR